MWFRILQQWKSKVDRTQQMKKKQLKQNMYYHLTDVLLCYRMFCSFFNSFCFTYRSNFSPHSLTIVLTLVMGLAMNYDRTNINFIVYTVQYTIYACYVNVVFTRGTRCWGRNTFWNLRREAAICFIFSFLFLLSFSPLFGFL